MTLDLWEETMTVDLESSILTRAFGMKRTRLSGVRIHVSSSCPRCRFPLPAPSRIRPSTRRFLCLEGRMIQTR